MPAIDLSPPQTRQGVPVDLSGYTNTAISGAKENYANQQEMMDWARAQFAKNADKSDQVTGRALDTMTDFANNAKTDRAMYEGTYMPAMKQQMDFAREYTTPGRMAANRGAAVAGSNLAFDANADAARRSLMSYGVDPSAGRFAGLDAGLAASRAKSAAAAGTKSDRDTEAMGQEYLDRAIRTGAVLPGQAGNEAGISMASGNQAVNTGLATTASGAATMGTPLQWNAAGADMLKEWPKALLAQTSLGMQQNRDTQAGSNENARIGLQQQQINQGSSSGIGALIGGGLGIVGGVLGGPMGGMLGSTIGNMAGRAASGNPSGSGFTFAAGGMVPDDGTGEPPAGEPTPGEPMPGDDMAGGDAEGGEDDLVDALGQEGNMVPPGASPSGGAATDDVRANVNVGEFIVPKDVTAWYGEKYMQGLIDKARKEMSARTAEPSPAPPQAMAMSPSFQSEGASA